MPLHALMLCISCSQTIMTHHSLKRSSWKWGRCDMCHHTIGDLLDYRWNFLGWLELRCCVVVNQCRHCSHLIIWLNVMSSLGGCHLVEHTLPFATTQWITPLWSPNVDNYSLPLAWVPNVYIDNRQVNNVLKNTELVSWLKKLMLIKGHASLVSITWGHDFRANHKFEQWIRTIVWRLIH